MVSNRDKRIINQLLLTAPNSTQRQKHASMVVMNGNPLSIGINSARNNPRYVISDTPDGIKSDIYSHHAERVAIKRAGDCNGATLYVARDGHRLSMPCERCMPTIIKAGIKKVIFTTDGGYGLIRL